MAEKGILLVVSGPSGAGKSTALGEFMRRNSEARYSVSLTTRLPREGEREGVNYFFVSRDTFEKYIEEGALIEWAEYAGNYYGTPREPVEEALASGAVVVLEIEVKGAVQVSKKCPEAVLVFLTPSDVSEVERRLRSRNTDSEEKILKRLGIAREEYKSLGLYKYKVTNDELYRAVAQLEAIVTAERCLIQGSVDK